MVCRRPKRCVTASILVADPSAVDVTITAVVVAVSAVRRRAYRCCPNCRCANRRSTVGIPSAPSGPTVRPATIGHAAVSHAAPSNAYSMPSETCSVKPAAVKPATMEAASERVGRDKGCAHKGSGCKANHRLTQHWISPFLTIA